MKNSLFQDQIQYKKMMESPILKVSRLKARSCVPSREDKLDKKHLELPSASQTTEASIIELEKLLSQT